MANYQSLKAAINAVIKANGNKEITGTVLNEVLLAMVNSLGAGYQFAGVATPSTNPGTPDQKVFYIASQAGTYTNFNGAVVSDGIAIFEWNGTWTTEMLDLSMAGQVQSDWTETDTTKKSYIKHKPNIPPSANVDPVPTEDSPNAVSSGGTYDMIVNTAATLFGDIQDATNVNAIESVDGKIYNDYQVGDIFFIVDDNVRKYRVALVAGTADAEHPVTISPVNFYYALNSADAINLSLTFKTVSTEQQSLSTQQKAQARTNIAAVSYEQQSLDAGQQVQAQNNMMGKAYSSVASGHSGLGKVYLDKNNGSLTQAMMQATNTVYVIQYDYTLAANITIPAGCTLEFDGGSITGGAVFSNNTVVKNMPDNLYILGRIYNSDGNQITYKGDVINRGTRLLFPISTLRHDADYDWLYDEYGISTQVKGSRAIGINECYVDLILNIAQDGTISFIDYITGVDYIVNYLKSQGMFNSVFGIRFLHKGYTTLAPSVFMDNLKTFELNVLQGLKTAGLEFENVFFANEREDWVSVTTPANEYIPYLISIAESISALGYTPYIDSTNWYHLSEADDRIIPYAQPSYNFYPALSMLDEKTVYSPDLAKTITVYKPAYGGLTYKDVGICESGTNSKQKALRNPAESDLSLLGDNWYGAKIVFARVVKDFINEYRPPFYGIWYSEGLTENVDLDELYNIYLTY